jgi:hypothetical protein
MSTELPTPKEGLGVKLLDLFLEDGRKDTSPCTGLTRNRYKGKAAFFGITLGTHFFMIMKAVNKCRQLMVLGHEAPSISNLKFEI